VQVLSNTQGIDPDNFFWQICNEPQARVQSFPRPTKSNPFLPLRKPNETFQAWCIRRAAYFDKLKAGTPPLVYEQEYRAEFVDWSGASFFALSTMLVAAADGSLQPVELPVDVTPCLP